MTVAGDGKLAVGDVNFWGEMDHQSAEFAPVMEQVDDAFIMLFTAGAAKGVAVPLRGMLSFYLYTHYAVDLRPKDKFWNIADPGWTYGFYYCVTRALMIG